MSLVNAAIEALTDPLLYSHREIRRSLVADGLPEVLQRREGKRVAHRFFGLQHDSVDGANAVRRPSRRGIAEHGAAAPNFLTVEQWLPTFNRIDDLEDGNLCRRAGEQIAAADAAGSVDDPRLFELGKYLGEEAVRNALKIGQVATAEGNIARTRQP